MRRLTTLVSVWALLGLSSASVLAGDRPGCTKAAKPGCGKTVKTGWPEAGTSHCSKACAQACCAWKPGCGKSLADCMPKMVYQVGEKQTGCSQEAKQLAGQEGKVHYVVYGKTYDDGEEATKALTAALNDFADNLLSVHMVVGDEALKCPATAAEKAKTTDSKVQYIALRQAYDTKEWADAAAGKATKAVEQVAMTYKIDGKPSKCSVTAGKCAQEGKKVEYCIGEQTTCCPIEADMLLAQAKVKALIEAINNLKIKKAASL